VPVERIRLHTDPSGTVDYNLDGWCSFKLTTFCWQFAIDIARTGVGEPFCRDFFVSIAFEFKVHQVEEIGLMGSRLLSSGCDPLGFWFGRKSNISDLVRFVRYFSRFGPVEARGTLPEPAQHVTNCRFVGRCLRRGWLPQVHETLLGCFVKYAVVLEKWKVVGLTIGLRYFL
jgi:hypothetical protein